MIDNTGYNEETGETMPHRKLVRIGETVSLPTISEFLKEMAARQHEEIQRLKREALSGKLPDPTVPDEHHDEPTPDAWQLHPVRVKKQPRKAARKKSSTKAKTAKRTGTAASKKAKKAPKPRASSRTTMKKTGKKAARKKARRS